MFLYTSTLTYVMHVFFTRKGQLFTSSDNMCKQFGPRSRSKLFDILMVVLKEFLRLC